MLCHFDKKQVGSAEMLGTGCRSATIAMRSHTRKVFHMSLPRELGSGGFSYSSGHVLWVGAVDRRVKCVVPLMDGWATCERLIRSDLVGEMTKTFERGT